MRSARRDARAYAFMRLSQFARAIEDYDAALQASPGVASSLFARGVAKLKMGRAAEGNADIDAAKQADAGVASTMANIGIVP